MPLAVPADDRVHQPDSDKGWRESYYFDFFDERLGLGIWHSIGKKPYKGHSGFTIGVWGMETLCGVGRDHFAVHDEEHRVAGLQYECVNPLEQWRLTYKGELVQPARQLRLAPEALLPAGQQGLPRVPVQFDLTFTGTSPAYRYHTGAQWTPLFSGHLDQTGRTTGTVTIGDKTYEVDGLGVRDRSWGTRDWMWPRLWRYIGLPSPELNLMLWHTEADGGVTIVDGFIESGGRLAEVVEYSEEVRTDPAALKPIPRSFTMRVKSSADSIVTITGEVVQIMPVVFGREHDGQMVRSWNDRALVRYHLPGGKTVHGIVEFADRLVSPL